MTPMRWLVNASLERPKSAFLVAGLVTLGFLWQFPAAVIDTDPENMLEVDQADRVFYQQVKDDFGIYDLIVVGIEDDEGIFRPETLRRLDAVAHAILEIDGVIVEDVLSFSTTDDVTSGGGFLTVDRIMVEPPETDGDALAIRDAIFDNPIFREKLVSDDGTAAAFYVPIVSKDQSHRVSQDIEGILARELDGQRSHVAGLPVAEDTFGFEMFLQMGLMAPLAMGVIFALLLYMFRQLGLVVPAMAIALLSVIWVMGTLIGSGFTVHIMSSMIPVFLMPVAVLDSVHVLSEFHDRYPALRDRRRTVVAVMEQLYRPMFYTSLTSAAGFASLALAPIPPVRVFGGFVAFGIVVAFILTLTLIPAGIMLTSEKTLEKRLTRHGGQTSRLDRVLVPLGRVAFGRSRIVVVTAAILLGLGLVGVSRIVVNDNPVNWFEASHPVRQADTAMNRLFGGTYMADVVVLGDQEDRMKDPEVMDFMRRLQDRLEDDPAVGKTTSIADVVARVSHVLHDGNGAATATLDSQEAIGQYLFLYLMSGDPNDLDNLVDYEYRQANIWVQLKVGDNQVIDRVVASVDEFLETNPLPDGVEIRWSGLTYINKVWQDLMVVGMRNALLGGAITVFLLMVMLFRSIKLALISMSPLTFAIAMSYGVVGWIGKDYDMPIAVCSSLALGLSVDFAIHFVERYRRKRQELGDLDAVYVAMFEEPARAISRNAVVIVVGFLPLVLSTLTPYVTVGVFFAGLMTVSSATTLVLLPALLHLVGPGPLTQRSRRPVYTRA